MSKSRVVKIFLASSEELVKDRRSFELFLTRKNKKWRNKNIAFDLIIWEDFLDSISETRKQADYNQALKDCDFFVLLFFSKVGKYTEEEFDTAYEQFQSTGKPEIFTYFKDAPIRTSQIRKEETKSLFKFQEKLEKLKHFYSLYETADGLNSHFYDQLEKLEQEGFFGESASIGPLDQDPLLSQAPSDEWLKEYLENTCEDLKHVKVPIPISERSRPLELEEVYVPLQIRIHHYDPTITDPSWTHILTEDRVAITGDAGSGKSTLLCYMALKLAKKSLKILIEKRSKPEQAVGDEYNEAGVELDYPGKIPIYVDLSKATNLWSSNTQSSEISPALWLTFFKNKLFSLTEQQVAGLFKTGNILFLFDGLDEVPEPGDRRMLINGVANLQRGLSPIHSSNKVVIACRSAAWEYDHEFVKFERVDVQPMGPNTYQKYLWNWCLKVWGDRAEEIYENLKKSISASPAVAHIATNPQMTTMLSLVQNEPLKKKRRLLPKQRALLYERFVEQFIKTGTGKLVANKSEIRDHLIALALEMQLQKNALGEPLNSLSVQDASNLLGKRIQEQSDQLLNKKAQFNKGEELLQFLEIHTGLLEVDKSRQLSQRSSYVRFKHRTFQEYLAACYYAETDVKGLLKHATDPGWAETMAMACGLLSEFDEPAIKEFLEELLRPEEFLANRKPTEKELVHLAPRVAAATICFVELASYDLAEDTLDPVRQAHNLMLPLIKNPESELSISTKVKIAEGLGTVYDPRLDQENRWVTVPAGTFVRGSESPEAWIQEQPCQEFELEEFKIQRWPVTVKEYSRFIEGGGYKDERWWSEESSFQWLKDHRILSPFEWEMNVLHGNRPVTGLSWWEAQAYCRWYTHKDLGLQKHWEVRLPTEAQWEKSAGGIKSDDIPTGEAYTVQRFPWGLHWKDNCANCQGTGPATPVPVGIFPAGYSQPYGLWDMAGNVNEWCLNDFGPYMTNGRHENLQKCGKAVRGGSFQSTPLDLRITNRFGLLPHQRNEFTGFRCVAVSISKSET